MDIFWLTTKRNSFVRFKSKCMRTNIPLFENFFSRTRFHSSSFSLYARHNTKINYHASYAKRIAPVIRQN